MSRGLAMASGRAVALLCGLSLACPAAAAAWSPEPERYGEAVTRDVPIRMRDGVVLRADVYRPANRDGSPAAGPFPVLLSETPYAKGSAALGLDILAGHRPYLVRRGFVQAIVDVRGQGGSGGSFQLFGPDEQADSVAVVRWASRLPGTTGRVGMTGESYLAGAAMLAAAAVGRGSPLKAIFPIVPPGDPYRDFVTSGGLLNIESDMALAAAYGALPLFAGPAQTAVTDPAAAGGLPALVGAHALDAFQAFSARTIADVLTDGDRAYDGAFWNDHRKPLDVVGQIVANRIPAYVVGGSYDVFQRSAPLLYAGLQNAWAGRPAGVPMAPRQRVTGRYQLLIKPEYHMTVDDGTPNLDELQLAWFDRWLKRERTGIEHTATPLHVVEPGGARHDLAHYPLPDAPGTALFLRAGGALSADAPTGAGADTLAFTGASLPCDRSTEQWALGALELVLRPAGLGDPCAAQDVVPPSAGPGQLTYETAPLPHDVLLGGPSAVRLYATATSRDTEWVAKLSDVAPGGASVDVTQGALLGSHRALDDARTWFAPDGRPLLPFHPDTRQAKAPVTPGAVVRYDVELRPAFRTLRAGHRLRLTLLSSQTPHLLPLPDDLLALAGGVYAVQRSGVHPSSLEVPLAPAP